jgi:hypothetical protein
LSRLNPWPSTWILPWLKNDVLMLVDLDDLVVELIADQDAAVAEHDGPSLQRHGHAAGPGVRRVVEHDILGVRHEQDADVVGVGDQGVTVGQPAGERGPAQLRAGRAAVLPDDVAGAGHLDDPVVVLVGDQDVAVGQFRGVGVAELVELVADDAGLAVLPHDVMSWLTSITRSLA